MVSIRSSILLTATSALALQGHANATNCDADNYSKVTAAVQTLHSAPVGPPTSPAEACGPATPPTTTLCSTWSTHCRTARSAVRTVRTTRK
ncbi:hypothetical protein PI124_g17225 [Phytophthora idaei]|nr:hypothetical protein PI125_g12461 [Phytophthora idaei]KAG3237796.1 hypothetical protein PI124_g17225 [Phytophthora idaei]